MGFKANSQPQEKPSAAELYGVPVCIEEKPSQPVRKAPHAKVKRQAARKGRGVPKGSPTPDELAGIPVTIEGEEDLTVRSRKGRSKN